MKYCVYDKAADGYLTKMVFDGGLSNDTQFECGLTEYITNAELLDTKKAAVDTIARIESFKFMEKGRFVVHQFDDTLANQYVISEAGNPTKVVDNITVDLDGAIDVKYGTMACHWSASSLDYVVNRLNRLQDASAPSIYSAWYNTFDIYKVITVIDERECTHCQFIKVTSKGLEEYANKEINPLNKRIEELEKANYDLGAKAAARGRTANRLQEEKDKLEAKVESIKKEARNWKTMYESALTDNSFPCVSAEACELLKDITDITRAKKLANDIIDIWEADDKFEVTLKKFSQLHEAVNDPSDDDDTIMYAFKGVLEIFSSLEDHVRGIIDESVEWKNKAITAEKVKDNQKKLNEANVATIVRYRNETMDMNKEIKELRTMRDCLAEIIWAVCNAITNNNTNAFDCIESRMWNDHDFNSDPFMAGARENIKDICAAAKRNITNYAFKCRELSKSAKELSDAADALEEVNDKNEGLTNMLKEVTDCIADIMFATRTRDRDKMISELIDISRKIGFKTRDDGPMYGVLFILSTLIRSAKDVTYWERRAGEALEQKEFYKRQANSVYGMTIPCRCNSKQMFYDVTTGKKILVDKDKYDDIVERINNLTK